jgi:putative endonuclease
LTHFVYAIKSEIDGRIYIGMSQNLSQRLKQHNNGLTKSTKGYKPWRLVYFEKYPSRLLARSREKYLKSGIGRELLKTKLIPTFDPGKAS